MTTTALVRTTLPLTTPEDWEARAAWWANRVIYWTFEPMSAEDRREGVQNAIEAMRESRKSADFARKWSRYLTNRPHQWLGRCPACSRCHTSITEVSRLNSGG